MSPFRAGFRFQNADFVCLFFTGAVPWYIEGCGLRCLPARSLSLGEPFLLSPNFLGQTWALSSTERICSWCLVQR